MASEANQMVRVGLSNQKTIVQELCRKGRIGVSLLEDVNCTAALCSEVFVRFLETAPYWYKINTKGELDGCIRLQWSRDYLHSKIIDKSETFKQEIWHR